MINIKRTGIVIEPNSKRVLLRTFTPGDEVRAQSLIARISTLTETEVTDHLQNINQEFSHRHSHLKDFFLSRFEAVQKFLPTAAITSAGKQQLLGACFSMEYSVESAALFNPSMVWHPDQSHLADGTRRFIVSLRATGEGHISSIVFTTGTIDSNCKIKLDKRSSFVSGAASLTMSETGYELSFDDDVPLGERVIFPKTEDESNGIEDARFVEFKDENGSTTYFATYTAYDGHEIYPKLLKTQDFIHFQSIKLRGQDAQNKGMALFPRKIADQYAMIGRQDGENLYIMFSDSLSKWKKKQLLLKPTHVWESVQLGNCGSPIETKAGWLLLTHGVGAMRVYSIGAILLDLNDPCKVIGHLQQPLLSANQKEREGYVPNVVYSCGGQIHQNKLILPYAMSDTACSFAIVDLNDLLSQLTL